MDRRGYLAGLAGAASLLAGCSAREEAGSPRGTVTPVPVPAGRSEPLAEAGTVSPRAVGNAHVAELAGASATVGAEYVAGDSAERFALTRVLSTVDGAGFTYRRYDVRQLPLGGTSRIFRGIWYEDGEAVLRLIEEGNRSAYHELEEYDPPPADARFDRNRLVAALDAFDPSAVPTAEGHRLTADSVARPERLPTVERLSAGSEGRLSARLESGGPVPELRAAFEGTVDGERVPVVYRLTVADRGATTVERPTSSDILEWYVALQERAPLETAATPTGSGDG